jgi:hypothetical protein
MLDHPEFSITLKQYVLWYCTEADNMPIRALSSQIKCMQNGYNQIERSASTTDGSDCPGSSSTHSGQIAFVISKRVNIL